LALKNYDRLVSHNWPCLKTNSHIPGVQSGIEFLNYFHFNGWTNGDQSIQHGLEMYYKDKEFKNNLTFQSNAQSQNPWTKPA
jgi:hypothetical protein